MVGICLPVLLQAFTGLPCGSKCQPWIIPLIIIHREMWKVIMNFIFALLSMRLAVIIVYGFSTSQTIDMMILDSEMTKGNGNPLMQEL